MAIVLFFSAHWIISAFFQSFFHHRYASHRMFTMTPRTERTFHVLTYLAQGSSYLSPRAYAILHREHHAYSDSARDPHAPGFFSNVLAMMWATSERYSAHVAGTSSPEARFLGGYRGGPARFRRPALRMGPDAHGAATPRSYGRHPVAGRRPGCCRRGLG